MSGAQAISVNSGRSREPGTETRGAVTAMDFNIDIPRGGTNLAGECDKDITIVAPSKSFNIPGLVCSFGIAYQQQQSLQHHPFEAAYRGSQAWLGSLLDSGLTADQPVLSWAKDRNDAAIAIGLFGFNKLKIKEQ